MSGGIAYIFDPNREFHAKCNKESVDLLPLQDEDDLAFMKEALKNEPVKNFHGASKFSRPQAKK